MPDYGDAHVQRDIPSTIARVIAVATAIFTLGIPMFLMAAAGAAIRKLGSEDDSTWKQMYTKTKGLRLELAQEEDSIVGVRPMHAGGEVKLLYQVPTEVKDWTEYCRVGGAYESFNRPELRLLRIIAVNQLAKTLGTLMERINRQKL